MTFTDALYEAIIAENIEDASKHTEPHIYPSSIGSCSRKIAYEVLGYKGEDEEPIALMRMKNGTYFHERVEALIKRTDIYIANEYRVVNASKKISGRSDLLIKNIYPHKPSNNIIKLYRATETEEEPEVLYEGPDNDIMIVELKSIKSKKYAQLLRDNSPKKEHEMQLQLYMEETGIKAGLIVYENKDTQAMKEFIVNYDPDIVAAVNTQINLVCEHIDRGELPPREYSQSDGECFWCKYKQYCWKDEDALDLHKLF